MDGSLHQELWRENYDLAEACLRHPFVQGLGEGSLPAEAFRRYVAQDAFFLAAFARAYAVGVAKSRDRETLATFRDLLNATWEELRLHAHYSETLGIDLTAVRPFRATRRYTDFLLATAWHTNLPEIVAAMTPCMRLYAYLGSALAQAVGETSTHPYREWIATYSGAAFQAATERLETLLDRLATERAPLQDAYRYAMQCELDFFSAPLGTER